MFGFWQSIICLTDSVSFSLDRYAGRRSVWQVKMSSFLLFYLYVLPCDCSEAFGAAGEHAWALRRPVIDGRQHANQCRITSRCRWSVTRLTARVVGQSNSWRGWMLMSRCRGNKGGTPATFTAGQVWKTHTKKRQKCWQKTEETLVLLPKWN